jgi:hypothetical protein
MNNKNPVVLYGASGYTGRLIAEFLREYPTVRPNRKRSLNWLFWLTSDKASYVTGTTHIVDGGVLSGFGG